MTADLIDNRINNDFLSRHELHTENFNLKNPSTSGYTTAQSMIIYLDWPKSLGQRHCMKLTKELA